MKEEEVTSAFCGRYIQDNGTVIVFAQGNVLYGGKAFPLVAVNATVCYNQDGDNFWYYIAASSPKVIHVICYPKGSGFHEAALYEGQTYKQANGTFVTLLKDLVLYGGIAYPRVDISHEALYNQQGGDSWYYFLTSSGGFHCVKRPAGAPLFVAKPLA